MAVKRKSFGARVKRLGRKVKKGLSAESKRIAQKRTESVLSRKQREELKETLEKYKKK